MCKINGFHSFYGRYLIFLFSSSISHINRWNVGKDWFILDSVRIFKIFLESQVFFLQGLTTFGQNGQREELFCHFVNNGVFDIQGRGDILRIVKKWKSLHPTYCTVNTYDIGLAKVCRARSRRSGGKRTLQYNSVLFSDYGLLYFMFFFGGGSSVKFFT